MMKKIKSIKLRQDSLIWCPKCKGKMHDTRLICEDCLRRLVKSKKRGYPLEIRDDSEVLAYIDFKGNYHCDDKNRMKTIRKLIEVGEGMKEVIKLFESPPKEK